MPAVAVIVAVRLALLAVPDEKVNVAIPAASVVTVLWLRMPVSALRVTFTSGTAAFDEDKAETVMVVVLELSDLTEVGSAESERDEAVTVAVAVVPVVTALPPQPETAIDVAKKAKKSLC